MERGDVPAVGEPTGLHREYDLIASNTGHGVEHEAPRAQSLELFNNLVFANGDETAKSFDLTLTNAAACSRLVNPVCLTTCSLLPLLMSRGSSPAASAGPVELARGRTFSSLRRSRPPKATSRPVCIRCEPGKSTTSRASKWPLRRSAVAGDHLVTLPGDGRHPVGIPSAPARWARWRRRRRRSDPW